MNITFESAQEKLDQFLALDTESDEYIEFGKQLLKEIRESGRYISDFGERNRLVVIAQSVAEGLYDTTGAFFVTYLLPFEPAESNNASSNSVNHTVPVDPFERLQSMPVETIPAPATLPTISRMPFSPNPFFVGREDALLKVACAFNQGTSTIAITAATGIGGIGKTQLASEFVHRYGQYFAGGVFWLSFADATSVPNEIAACGGVGAMNLPDFDSLDLSQQGERVLKAWRDAIPRLIVFDNCEDDTLYHTWKQKLTSGGCRILITSRRSDWIDFPEIHLVSLELLPRAESISLLRKFRPEIDNNDSTLDAIAAELGDLPLALHLAGSYLKQYASVLSPANFLSQLQQPDLLEHRALVGKHLKHSPTNHELHIARSFALSYDQLQTDNKTDVLAREILARMAYFAPGEQVPRDLLHQTVLNERNIEHEEALIEVEDALNRLIGDVGILEEETNGALRMHRLVVRFVQNMAEDDKAQAIVEETILNTANKINNAGDPRPLHKIQSHLRYITDTARIRKDERAAALCNALGVYLQMIGDYSGARPYFEHALAIREAILGSEHPDTAQSLNNLGYLLYVMGNYAGAKPYYERALAIQETVLEKEHPNIAQSLNNLGMVLESMGNYDTARYYYERALAITERVLGGENPDTAYSLNNLGSLLHAMGEIPAARPYYKRALAINERVLGPEHPNTANTLNNLALLYSHEGDYQEAARFMRRALTIYESILGPDHPHTKSSRQNLAVIEQQLG